MSPLLGPILFARPCGSPTVSRLLDLRRLHLNPRVSPSTPCMLHEQRWRGSQQWFIRLFSSEGKGLGNGNGGGTYSPDSSGQPNVPPFQSEFGNLPSQEENKRLKVSKKFSVAMDDLQTAMFSAGQKLNEITGYSGIEALRKSIEQQESHVKASRQAVRDAKEQYQAAINRRSASQREVNELLQRKHAWTPVDLERFTELYRSDHANEQTESSAQEQLVQAERVADEAQAGLTRSILARYHEEQIWSDKIRRASTWGTWGLMGFNVLLFIVVQLGLEPWKRRRLVGGFEEKVREVIREEGLRNALLAAHTKDGETEGSGGVPEAPVPSDDKEVETAGGLEGVSFADQGPTADATRADASDTTAAEGTTAVEDKGLVEEVGEDTARKQKSAQGERLWLGHLKDEVTDKAEDLFSERVVSMKQVDLTTTILKSAALGAFVAATISLLLSKR